MHKLYDFVCKELKELEDKVDKGLTSADLENAVKLTEMKKNILKIWKYEDDDNSGGMSRRMMYPRYDGYSRRRGYSYDMSSEDIIDQLENMRAYAPDEFTRREISKLIDKMHNI